MFLTQVSSKDREFVQRLELSGNESFHRHISGSSVTPGHCADWEPHTQSHNTTLQIYVQSLAFMKMYVFGFLLRAPVNHPRYKLERKIKNGLKFPSRHHLFSYSCPALRGQKQETGGRREETENITKMRALKLLLFTSGQLRGKLKPERKTKILYFKNVKKINFSERKFYVLPLCHIAFYFLSVVRTNYLSIFEQGKVKPGASSPRTAPENKHLVSTTFSKYL